MLDQNLHLFTQPYLEELVRQNITKAKLNNITPVFLAQEGLEEKAGVLYFGFASGYGADSEFNQVTVLMAPNDEPDYVPYDVVPALDGESLLMKNNGQSKLAFFKSASGKLNFIGFLITLDGSIQSPDNPEPPPPSGDNLKDVTLLQLYSIGIDDLNYGETLPHAVGFYKATPYVTNLMIKQGGNQATQPADGEIGVFSFLDIVPNLSLAFDIGAASEDFESLVGTIRTIGAATSRLPWTRTGGIFHSFVFDGKLSGIRIQSLDIDREPLEAEPQIRTSLANGDYEIVEGAVFVRVWFDFYDGQLFTTEPMDITLA